MVAWEAGDSGYETQGTAQYWSVRCRFPLDVGAQHPDLDLDPHTFRTFSLLTLPHSKVKASSTAKGTILELLAHLLRTFPGALLDPTDRKLLGGCTVEV